MNKIDEGIPTQNKIKTPYHLEMYLRKIKEISILNEIPILKEEKICTTNSSFPIGKTW